MALLKKKNHKSSVKLGSRTKRSKLIQLFVVLLVAAVGTKLLISSLAATSSFTLLATHPQASLQPTALGKTLLTLKSWNNKIYAGYGDYDTNTGPISITPFDPQTNTFAAMPDVSDQTEAIYIFRNIGGNLYAPSTDPRGGYSTDYAKDAAPGGPSNWTQVGAARSQHAFDMATFNGSDLWLMGTEYNSTHASAWRSTDGGATWQLSLSVPPTQTATDAYARFYWAGNYNGKLYVQGFDSSSQGNSAQPTSYVFDGTSWTKGPNILSTGGMGYHTESFAGKMIFLAWQGYPSATSLAAFDGTKSVIVNAPAPFWDYAVENNTFYGLGSNYNVYSSTDLVNWYLLAMAPSTARSITVLNGQIYVGTTDSKIYGAAIPSTPDPVSLSGGSGGTTSGSGSTKTTKGGGNGGGHKKP